MVRRDLRSPVGPMKIAYVAEDVHKNAGVPRCVAELVERVAVGSEVVVISRQLRGLAATGIRFYRVPTLGDRFVRLVTFMIGANLVLAYLMLVRRERFDIVHSTAFDGGLFANIVTFHFCAREGLHWDGYSAAQVGMSWPRLLAMTSQLLYHRLLALVERLVLWRQIAGVTVSDRAKQDFVRHYGMPAQCLAVIGHGVDNSRFHPRNRALFRKQVRECHGIGDEEAVFLFVGGDWQRKGLDVLLDALAASTCLWKLLVVGDDELGTHRQQARALGIERNVVFAGRQEAVEQYFAAADVFVMPTRYEPFGLVVLEAMASGLPVITSACAGAASLIRDGIDGFLLEAPQDRDELLRCVTTLANDAELREAMGARARETAVGCTWEAAVAAHRELYQAVIRTRLVIGSGEAADA